MNIPRNVGGADRIIRVIMGVTLLLLVPCTFVGPQSPRALLGLFGLPILLSGISGYCPRSSVGRNQYRKALLATGASELLPRLARAGLAKPSFG